MKEIKIRSFEMNIFFLDISRYNTNILFVVVNSEVYPIESHYCRKHKDGIRTLYSADIDHNAQPILFLTICLLHFPRA